MAYYDTIRNASTFSKIASAEKVKNFDALSQSGEWESAVSRWGRKHLFASRVICSEPKKRLSLFVDRGFYPKDLQEIHPCIGNLISGPREHASLVEIWEPQIVQQYQPDSLGYVWAALASFTKAGIVLPSAAMSDRPSRERRAPPQLENFIPSASIQIGSSSPTRPSSGDTSNASVGFTPKISAPLLEDLTVRLASCFIRCVINYSQPFNKMGPFVCYRDERQTYNITTLQEKRIKAVDDGGVQLCSSEEKLQIAMLEGKRTFQGLVDGKPTVSDQVLAQMVGEALALKRDNSSLTISDDRFITILAITHYIKLFSFHITDDFVEEYETFPNTYNAHMACFLRADSTVWFDVAVAGHRKEIVCHLLAMMAWADSQP